MTSGPKRRVLPYVVLLPLFALALFYQLTYSYMVFDVRAGHRELDIPILTQEGGKITDLSAAAEKAGLRKDDIVLTIEGKVVEGGRDFFRSLHARSSGIPLKLTILRKSTGQKKLIAIAASPNAPESVTDMITTGALTAIMLLCVVIGIYPAAILPGDPRAWIFFGMMAATAQVINSAQWFDFPRPLQYFAYIFHSVLNFSSPIWLILFGLYFPQKFSWDVRHPFIKWIFLGPIIVIHCLMFVGVSDWYFSFSRMAHTFDFLHVHSTGPFVAASVVFFFVALSTKLVIAVNRDARRRLRILLTGCAVSLVPLIALVFYQSFSVRSNLAQLPQAFLIPVCFLFCLFPITLAYVIVAERAMELRVVIRQGLRYTLARAGLRVLSSVILCGLFFPLSGFFFQSKWTNLSEAREASLKISLYAAIVVAGVLLMQRTRQRLVGWVDKRFFREAYNAEVILGELNESIRSMVDEAEMLRTVANRISESLHVPQFTFLLNNGDFFHPVYCLGLDVPPGTCLSENSKTVSEVKEAKTPAPIYFDREDNWVYSTPESELSTLKTLHAQLLLPLEAKSKLLGIMTLGQKRSEEPYSRTDVQLLRSIAAQTGLAIENSRLTKTVATEIAQREKLNREIEIAREVQERLFPQRLPAIAGIDYSGACRPALGVGGDYYDFLGLADGDLGIAIGDVSGKGIAAALLMASLQASLRGQALMGQGNLAQLMANVNQLVYDASPVNRYATFFYGQYHRASGLFRYVNAGHNPPFILRRGDAATHVIRLETGGPVIGLFPSAPYQEGSLRLQAGDIFVGFTDGISEAMNHQDEEWGEERFIPAVTAYAHEKASELIPRLIAEADRFASGAPQHDDMTLVVMKLDRDVDTALAV